jgi:hypothetical protein
MRCPPSVSLGVASTSLALMLTQIVLTRIFSVVVWYHFAFFAISVALLGLSASALAVHAFQHYLLGDRTPKLLAVSALVFAASILALGTTILHVTPDWFGGDVTSFTPKLLAVFVLTTTPFFLGGLVLGLALSRWPEAIHRNYASDLAGAALACALVIPLLDWLGGPKALLAATAFAVAAAPLFLLAYEGDNVMRRVLAAGLAGLLLVGAGTLFAANGGFEIRAAKGRDLVQIAPEFNRWNSFSLVSVFPSQSFRGWGLSPNYRDPVPPEKGLVIDMNAFTPLLAFDGDFSRVKHTRFDLSALAFRLRSDLTQACIVGAGGGKDVLAALAAGAKRVVAVEVNPLIAQSVMRERYRSFNGGLYDRPDVELHIEDGRSYLRQSTQRFDVILISMVDTSAATAAGSYALAENSLYTVDAFRDFLERLEPDGLLTVASVSFEGLAVGARLASLARQAVKQIGGDPSRSVAVVDTPWLGMPGATMYNLVIKRSGFTSDEVQRLTTETEALAFHASYLPGQSAVETQDERSWIAHILTESSDATLQEHFERWPLDVTPVNDDRPYFFYQNRLRDSWHALWSPGATHLFGNGLVVLLKVLLAAMFMVALCLIAPLWWMSRHARERSPRERRYELVYISLLGVGFMFIELGCVQRLMSYLGSPTHSLTAVLLVLLLAGGAGSRFAAGATPVTVMRLLLALVGYALVWTLGWTSVAEASAALPIIGRALLAAVSLVPLGFLMGVALPSGLAIVRARDAQRVSWLWGVNGAASVLGSVLATLGSMHAGITALLLVGALVYLGAAVVWRGLTSA